MARRPDRLEHRQYAVSPLVDAAIASIRTTITDHERGIFHQSALLADRLERNTRIMSALATRTRGVVGLPFSILPSDGDKRRSAKVAETLTAIWPEMVGPGVVEELLRQRVTMGFGLAEVVWTTTRGRWLPTMRPWHLSSARWDDESQAFDVLTRDAGSLLVRRGDPRWFILGPHRSWMRGVVRCLPLESESRELAVRDWARWCEKHGLPVTVAQVPPTASETDKSRFLDQVAALGSESTVLAPAARSNEEPGFDVQFREVVDRGWQGFDKLLDVVATDVAIAITGHNLTTEVKGGSLAAAQVGDRVRYDYLEADVEDFSGSSHDQFLGDWAEFNFGDRGLAPKPHWDASPPEDIQKRSQTHKTAGEALTALVAAGVPVDVRKFAESYGVPMLAPGAMPPTRTEQNP